MKMIKQIAQVLAAFAYTPIYTGTMYCAFVFLLWIITLSTNILILFFIFALIEFVIYLLQLFGLFPFSWIVRDNRVSLWSAVALCVVLPGVNIVSLWKALLPHGTFGVILALGFSGTLIQFIVVSVGSIIGLHNDD